MIAAHLGKYLHLLFTHCKISSNLSFINTNFATLLPNLPHSLQHSLTPIRIGILFSLLFDRYWRGTSCINLSPKFVSYRFRAIKVPFWQPNPYITTTTLGTTTNKKAELLFLHPLLSSKKLRQLLLYTPINNFLSLSYDCLLIFTLSISLPLIATTATRHSSLSQLNYWNLFRIGSATGWQPWRRHIWLYCSISSTRRPPCINSYCGRLFRTISRHSRTAVT